MRPTYDLIRQEIKKEVKSVQEFVLIKQHGNNDCGVALSAMLLSTSYREQARDLPLLVSGKGISPSDLKRYLNKKNPLTGFMRN